MCVIAIKKHKVKLKFSTIQDMWFTNPDGAGIARISKDNTCILKGYMDLETLWTDLNQMQDEMLILHFRLATHGLKSQEMTHPFIISPDLQEATSIYTTTNKPVLVHNGIISHYGNNEISDTAHFITEVLAHTKSYEEAHRLLKLTGCKFAYAHNGKVKLIGHFEHFKGLYVSNLYFDWSIKRHENKIHKQIDYNYNNWDTSSYVFSGNNHSTKKFK